MSNYDSHIEIYKSIIEHNPDAICILSLDGTIMKVNPAVCQLFGYSEEYILGLSYKEMTVPSDIDKVQQQINIVLTGQPAEAKVQACHKNGSIIDLQVKYIPLKVNHDIVGICCVMKDITELCKTKEFLKDVQNRLLSFFNSTADAIDILDIEGNVLDVNPAFEKIYGWKREEVIGKPLMTIPKNKLAEAKKMMNKVKNGESITRFDWIGLKKDGTIIDISLTMSPIFDPHGKVVALSTITMDISKQKHLERSLKESEERYRKVVELSPKGIVVHRNGNILYANPFALKSAKEKSLLGKSIFSYIHPNFHELSKRRLSEAEHGKKLPFIEMQLKRKDGTIFYVEITGVSIDYDDGPAILSIFTDITDRKSAEEAFRKSEEEYRLITENMTDLVSAVDENGSVIYASPSYERVLGFSPENYVGNLAFDLIHPDDLFKAKKQFDHMVATKESIRVEYRLKHASGKWIWTEAGGNPVYDENGHLLYFLIVGREISSRKKVEEALRLSEKRYRLLADNSLDLIQLVNLNGIVTYASPSHKTVLGYDPEEYVGKIVFHQPNGKIDDNLRKAITNMARNYKPFSIEVSRTHKAGYDVWLDVNGTPVYDDDGQYKYMMIVAREITDRKKYQKQLEYLSFHDTLTGLPNRRFFSEQLKQSIKEAKRYQRKVALLFLDVDRFKHINDTFGHDVGDELLKQFTNRVQSCIRESDILVRWGGDEFIILLSKIENEKQVTNIAERIIFSLQSPWNLFGQEFKTTSSIGIAFYEEGDTEKELLKKADIALYQAKSEGKNTFCFYHRTAKEKSSNKKSLL
ncbi:PAS domain S-box protein [Weizmannia acidilactici]|uniref:PAS domain S-box protein n=2 Tax=Weizmannia acidilactici TaxID=2607726 RepID=UPI00124DA539|nr:PAS domain S-box protein [Weizmannia acidilactici]GER68568.1 hypothetical protein BpJC4_30390 [Weizmannia acidilactici]GER75006.1 hypothetical protein BpPP18_30730 [Weizmannia acidilactici]